MTGAAKGAGETRPRFGAFPMLKSDFGPLPAHDAPGDHARDREDAMKLRPALLLAAALLAACSTEPVSPEQRAADQCRLFRGYMSTQEHFRVMEACTRQMGEEACRKCLWE